LTISAPFQDHQVREAKVGQEISQLQRQLHDSKDSAGGTLAARLASEEGKVQRLEEHVERLKAEVNAAENMAAEVRPPTLESWLPPSRAGSHLSH
jgi:peptidoglycan hydrolase CwlO-like protein